MTGIEPITSILIGGLVYKSVDKQKLKYLILLNILFQNNQNIFEISNVTGIEPITSILIGSLVYKSVDKQKLK